MHPTNEQTEVRFYTRNRDRVRPPRGFYAIETVRRSPVSDWLRTEVAGRTGWLVADPETKVAFKDSQEMERWIEDVTA